MWSMHGQKWCKDNSVVPFLAIYLFYTVSEGFVEKVFVTIRETIFSLYNMHIIVLITNCRLLDNSALNVFCKVLVRIPEVLHIQSRTIIRSVIVNTVESAKPWWQNNLDFTVFLNCRITIFRKFNIFISY